MATLQGGEYHDGGPNGQGHYDNGNHNGLDNGSGANNATVGHDSLFGATSHDAVAQASDSVNGAHQSSSDIVSGAQSASTDTSGAAHDTTSHDAFVFTGGGGHDVVMNFQQGQDLLHIAANVNGLNISSPADVAAHVTSVHGNAVVDLGHGDTITLHGVTADEVHHNPGAFFTVS